MRDLRKAIDLISADELIKVVSFLKWDELSTLMDGRVRQFISPDKEYTALIPLDRVFSDYNRVITETLQSIAAFEHINIGSLINRIIYPSYDILKWRIENDFTSSGKIPFFRMTDTIENIKDILAVSCLDILNPSKFHNKIYTNDVNNNISGYSFGQTEFGSYILNILCPLGNYEYVIFDPIEEKIPLNRKINMRLLSSIDNIQKDFNKKDFNKVDEDIDKGVYSVNFLDSLTRIYSETKDTEMNIIADWCKDVKFVDDFPSSDVKLEPIHIERVNILAEKYRPKKEGNVSKTYYGKIESIAGNPEVENREFVQIKIVTIGDDNKKQTVLSKLDYNSFYSVAKAAFEAGSDIKLSGLLNNTGKQKWIENGSLEKLE